MAPNSRTETDKIVAAWLFALAAMVFLMIVLGGVTRLTHSGLSMVDWRPVSGWLPPLGAAEWEAAFARYREFPEYKRLNLGMTLAEFQSIFWLEYAHRLWGRIIGVAFLAPLAVFLVKGWVGRRLAPRLIGLFVLGGLQGGLGWYMVKSGLVARPDVSQYRLAAHLALAFFLLGYMLWVGLGLIGRKPVPASAEAPDIVRRLGLWASGLLALVFVTVLSGAFVAGLDAGFVYNTFPLMDGKLAPDGMFELSPVYLNFFENIPAVQFTHRVLAMAVLAAVAALWVLARGAPLARRQRLAVNALAAVAGCQVALGISTLLLVVPLGLAAAHQAGAVALLSTAVWLVHEFRGRLPGEEGA